MKDKTVVAGFYFRVCVNFFLIILYFCYVFLTDGDIEVNPEPRKS